MENPFEGMMEGPTGNPFRDLMAKIFQSRAEEEDHYEPIAPLTEKDSQEWDRLINEYEKAKSRLVELDARKKLFWIRLERKLKIYDRGLKIEGGMVLGEVVKKSNCHMPGERAGIPGFCDGDCANCALKPEIPDEDIEQ